MTSAVQIMQVVRGEALWSSLNSSEVIVERDGDSWTVLPANIQAALPSEDDVAIGLAHFASMPGELRDWASFILAASPLIDLAKLGASPLGAELLDALWDISSGEPVDPRLVEWLADRFPN